MTITIVKSSYLRNRCNHRLRFGSPVHILKPDKTTKFAAFHPGEIFGYIRWSRNQYGTDNWQIIIAKAGSGKRLSVFPGIHPGADILFRARGVKASQSTLKWLDRIEKNAAVSLPEIPPSFWRKAENARIIRMGLPLYQAHKLEPFHV